MIIILWVISFSLFSAVLTLLLYWAARHPGIKRLWHTLVNGFQEGLKDSGFVWKSNAYTVELYQWVLHDHHACEDCVKRSQWAPMDIADWMKAGLPGTPEADTACGEECGCELILVKTTRFAPHPSKSS